MRFLSWFGFAWITLTPLRRQVLRDNCMSVIHAVCVCDLMDEGQVLLVLPRYRSRSLLLSVYAQVCSIFRNRFVFTTIFELHAFQIAFILLKIEKFVSGILRKRLSTSGVFTSFVFPVLFWQSLRADTSVCEWLHLFCNSRSCNRDRGLSWRDFSQRENIGASVVLRPATWWCTQFDVCVLCRRNADLMSSRLCSHSVSHRWLSHSMFDRCSIVIYFCRILIVSDMLHLSRVRNCCWFLRVKLTTSCCHVLSIVHSNRMRSFCRLEGRVVTTFCRLPFFIDFVNSLVESKRCLTTDDHGNHSSPTFSVWDPPMWSSLRFVKIYASVPCRSLLRGPDFAVCSRCPRPSRYQREVDLAISH